MNETGEWPSAPLMDGQTDPAGRREPCLKDWQFAANDASQAPTPQVVVEEPPALRYAEIQKLFRPCRRPPDLSSTRLLGSNHP